MTRTTRVFWGQTSTGWHNFNWNAITPRSVVLISASEGAINRSLTDPMSAITHRRGDASIYVRNINPHGANGGGVEFFLEVDWRTPLDVTLDIIVMDPPESAQQA